MWLSSPSNRDGSKGQVGYLPYLRGWIRWVEIHIHVVTLSHLYSIFLTLSNLLLLLLSLFNLLLLLLTLYPYSTSTANTISIFYSYFLWFAMTCTAELGSSFVFPRFYARYWIQYRHNTGLVLQNLVQVMFSPDFIQDIEHIYRSSCPWLKDVRR